MVCASTCLAAAGCASDSDDDGGDEITLTNAPVGQWSFVPFDDAFCANGEPTGLGVNLSDTSDNLIFYLAPGGACYSEATCAGAANIEDGFDAGSLASLNVLLTFAGFFNRTDANNPFREWNYIFVPYCTGDVHIGSNPNGFGDRNQVGFENVKAYLRRVVPAFSDANQVLLAGSSAGGFGVSFNFPQVQEAFGQTEVLMLNDSAPPLTDEYLPVCLQEHWRNTWLFDGNFPADCIDCVTEDGGGLINYLTYQLNRFSDRRFGFLTSLEDTTTRRFYGDGLNDCDFMENLLPAEDFRAGVVQLRDEVLSPFANGRTFYIPGESHTFVERRLSQYESGGVTLDVWLTQFIQGDAAWDHAIPEE